MGTETIPERNTGETAVKGFWNVLREVLAGAHVPRNTSGVATDQFGGLGTSLLRWGTSYINKIIIGDPTDNVSIEDVSAKLQVKVGGVESANCDANGWQRNQIETRSLGTAYSNVSISASCNNFITLAGSYVDVTNLSVPITTKGGPVLIMLIPDGTTVAAQLKVTSTANTSIQAQFKYVRDSTDISFTNINKTVPAAGTTHAVAVPPGAFQHIDIPTAGTYVYKMSADSQNVSNTVAVTRCKLVVMEL